MRKIKVIKSHSSGNIQNDIDDWLESEEAQGIIIIMTNATTFKNSFGSDMILTYILYEDNGSAGIKLNS